MLYFAHGSNLDRPQMLVRCPSARFLATARASGYRICFPRWSVVRDTAVASIEPQPGGTVWGALYDLSDHDAVRLDIAEGYWPDRPKERNVSQRMAIKAVRRDGSVVEAQTHFANPSPKPGVPSQGYLLVLVRAAQAFDFPADYLAELRALQQPLAA